MNYPEIIYILCIFYDLNNEKSIKCMVTNNITSWFNVFFLLKLEYLH